MHTGCAKGAGGGAPGPQELGGRSPQSAHMEGRRPVISQPQHPHRTRDQEVNLDRDDSVEQNHKWGVWGGGSDNSIDLQSFQNTLGKMALSTPIGLEKQIRPQVGWKGCEPVGWDGGCAEALSPAQGPPHWPTGPASLETPHTPYLQQRSWGSAVGFFVSLHRATKTHRAEHYRRQEGVLT